MQITNPNKIIFPKSKIKKIDVAKYYADVAKLMLPFVEKRLLSVIRCHTNINEQCFFKKHPTTEVEFENSIKIEGEEYFFIEKDYELIYQVQLGTLEFHTWCARAEKPNKPDVMVLDLDPDEKMPLKHLQQAVEKVKCFLDELNLKCFLKTSGGKGYHIVIPFLSSKNYDKFYEFSKNIALVLEQKYPKIFTTNIKKNKRKNKIFIDYLRNNKGSTCVAPYSVRARENAPISMPISWDNLYNISPNEITIKNYRKYLTDAWKDFFKVNQKIN